MVTNTKTDNFGAFFRRYTKTWVHAVATAGLTAFGTLTIYYRGFAVLALASYVVPPIALYVARGRRSGAVTATDDEVSRSRAKTDPRADRPEPGSSGGNTQSTRAVETNSGTGTSTGASSDADEYTNADADSDTDTDMNSAVDTDADTDSNADTDADGTSSRPEKANWTTVDSPTDATLCDVAVGTGAVAVGTGGTVLLATDDGWEAVLEHGPAGQDQDLYGVDVTDDGGVAWIAGDGGAVARLEMATGRHTDFSAPDDRTDNLTGLAAAGATGDETVLLITGSGAVVRGRYRDGDLAWAEPVTPGSGSSLSGVTLRDAETGFCCDTNDGVFRTDDGGRTFDAIGIDGSEGTLTDVVAGNGEGEGEETACHASTDAGFVYRYEEPPSTWTPDRVGDDAITAIARAGSHLVAINDQGGVYDRPDLTADWEHVVTGASGPLYGVAIGAGRAVAVGEGGTVLERQ
ncbi:sialidase family protein [Natronosalvus rutilus]|uniref:MSCRAMM family adhesin SdrC n=1 Tax=Natronosalvus rutilus TaxID=2953753 RepID=A0A9E7NAS2_9EURY|nr:MSCRAMM family adhesin SdrC [Natronosalvus rutilus]UTF53450.1 MSCRAMM family adhesin SdrC [Natronosalvus rutilus]